MNKILPVLDKSYRLFPTTRHCSTNETNPRFDCAQATFDAEKNDSRMGIQIAYLSNEVAFYAGLFLLLLCKEVYQ